MNTGFCVLNFPFLLVLINSYDIVNAHKLTRITILCILEVHLGVLLEEKTFKTYKIILCTCVPNIVKDLLEQIGIIQ